jgi:steroid delta-isomerase-like uncharacterized protein
MPGRFRFQGDRSMKYRFWGLLVVAVVSVTGISAARGRQDTLHPEQIAQSFVDAYNAHDVAKLMLLYADDLTVVSPDLTVVKGKADNQRYYEAWFQSVPDVKSTIKTVTTDADRFVLELVETGTYTKRLPTPGSPRAHGQKMRYPYVIVATVRGGKMTSMRIYENDKVIEQQLAVR